MSALINRQAYFLRLLLTTSIKQRLDLIKKYSQSSQMKAIVQIVYNVLVGNRILPSKDINKMKKHKVAIRRFVSKGLSLEKRKRLLVKYFKCIVLLLKVIKDEL